MFIAPQSLIGCEAPLGARCALSVPDGRAHDASYRARLLEYSEVYKHLAPTEPLPSLKISFETPGSDAATRANRQTGPVFESIA